MINLKENNMRRIRVKLTNIKYIKLKIELMKTKTNKVIINVINYMK